MPDAVIYLGDGDKNIVVDSKASIVNFLEYTNAQNDDEINEAVKKILFKCFRQGKRA